MKSGTVLGHEGIGIVEEVGEAVRNFKAGDRVVVPSTIACGNCSYCRAGYYAQCDRANPLGPDKGTAFYGGPIIHRFVRRDAGGVCARAFREHQPGEAAGGGGRRPGDHTVGHFPDRIHGG